MAINRTQTLVLGFFALAWASDGRGPTLALDVLADTGGLPFRAASRGGVRPGARRGTPPGGTDLVRAVSGPPWPAAVRHSPVHAGRLQASRRVGCVLRHFRRLWIAPEGTGCPAPPSLERVEGVFSEVHIQHPALGEPTWKFFDRETVGMSVGQEV